MDNTIIDVDAVVTDSLVYSKELKIDEITPASIIWNINEYSNYLDIALKNFKGLLVTEDNLKEMIAEQKKLSSVRAKLDTQRKRTKEQLTLDASAVNGEFNKLIAKIKRVEEPLKIAISEFEEKRKADKKVELEIFIGDRMMSYGVGLKYKEQFNFDDRWLNKSIPILEVQGAINKEVERLKALQETELQNIETIKKLVDEKNATIDTKLDVNEYIALVANQAEMSNVIDVLSNDYRLIKNAEDNAKSKAEQATISKMETTTQVGSAEIASITHEVIEEPKVAVIEPVANETTWKYVVEFTGTTSQIKGLLAFLEANKMDYKKISHENLTNGGQ